MNSGVSINAIDIVCNYYVRLMSFQQMHHHHHQICVLLSALYPVTPVDFYIPVTALISPHCTTSQLWITGTIGAAIHDFHRGCHGRGWRRIVRQMKTSL